MFPLSWLTSCRGLSGLTRALVSWHGRYREVVVLEMGSAPLLGMSLLLDCRLTISCRPNGAVVIEEEEF